ncbi:copper transporter [Cellulomonas sp. KRMCY2]|uniref:copper transporter n=1 Tax=Cellulomonas sp. KRMCY2 TaxID=1304865 RepID=UPI00045E6931|nr:copper transporter [Cellulomonas sp. KRMCY2]
MIDFRYHLVSLISVFMALAVGIALGAGPLKEAIGDTLTGQVDVLRAEKDALREELNTATADLRTAETAFAATAPGLLDGILAERRVAIVEVSDVEPEVLAQVVERLGQAGASVTATVQVTEEWTDPDRKAYRQSLAGTLVDYLDPTPEADAGVGTELAEALTQALTTPVPTDPDALSVDAGVVLDLLSESGLIVLGGDVTVPADAVVILAGPTVSVEEVVAETEAQPSVAPEAAAAAAALVDAQVTAGMQIATAAQARSNGAIVAGGELIDPSLVLRLRQDESAATRISTVESVNTLTGQVSVPMALSARLGGTVGHFGPSDGATAPMPPHIVLPPVERIPQVVDPGVPGDGTAVPGTDPTASPETEQG